MDVLFQLVQRTKEAVQLLDNQNYRRLQKMLMSAEEEGEEPSGENDDIESEPPRWAGLSGSCDYHMMGSYIHALVAQ